MFRFLLFTVAYWVVLAAWFVVIQKPVFWLWNRHSNGRPTSPSDVRRVFTVGFISDSIVTSYLTALPLIIALLGATIPAFNAPTVLTVYNSIVAIAIGLLVVGDTALYRFWNSKIDASVFAYLRHPQGAAASVSAWYIVGFVVAWILLSATLFAALQFVTAQAGGWISAVRDLAWWQYPLMVLAMLAAVALLYLLTRGLGNRPYNPSVVCFSPNPFLNHWALNPGFGMLYSLTTTDVFRSTHRYFSPEELAVEMDGLFPTSDTPKERLLKTDRPNILFIIWESLSAEFAGCCGGNPEVSPNLDRLAREGVVFTNVTAGSVRTDRGLLCALSGLPGQTNASLIRYTRKLPALPALPAVFRDLGYTTTALHGGDLSFMHFADYLLASGHDNILGQSQMPRGLETCKWGIHDGPMMDYIYDDIIAKTRRGERFFTSFLTLSSHEPFIVPYSRLSDPIDNSFAYTDAALGHLMDRLRQSPAWDNLLVVVMADHGFNRTMLPVSRVDYAHIPIVMGGGAILKPRRIDTIMSQTDFAATLLAQLDLPHDRFIFSRDILADTYRRPFAFHVHYSGFMVVDPDGSHTEYDTLAQRAEADDNPARIRRGKAILQSLYDYIASL